jgi:hypothetical protein
VGKGFFRLLPGFFPQKSQLFSNAEQHKSFTGRVKVLKAGANIQLHPDFIHVLKWNSCAVSAPLISAKEKKQ